MATKEEIAAQLETINTALVGVVERLDVLDEDSDGVSAEIQKLKDAIAAGGPPDLSAIEAGVAKLSETVASVRAKVGEAASPPPPPPEEPNA